MTGQGAYSVLAGKTGKSLPFMTAKVRLGVLLQAADAHVYTHDEVI